jgi:hypothetical protein
MKNNTCNCFIGIMNSYESSDTYDIYVNDYIDKINEITNISNKINKILYNGNIVLKPLDFLDKNKSLSKLFTYCPNCGQKINYNILKENLK